MPNALKLVADVLLITDRDLACGALIGEQDDGKARMLRLIHRGVLAFPN